MGAPAAAGTAAPHAKSNASSPGLHFGIIEPACTPATSGDAQCFAVKRVSVAKGTAGALSYPVSSAYPVGPDGGYTPGDLLTAYGLTGLPANAGSGQTVALIDAFDDPNALSDLNTFDSHYGLPAETASTFVKINQNGLSSPLPAHDTTGWSAEETLDVDAVRGMCNHCKIMLVEANSTSFSNLAAGVAAAAAAGATEISNSYGSPEGTLSTSAKNQQVGWYNFPGVVITASTGDDGWNDWDSYNDGDSAATTPELPSSLPDVVATGGTALTLNSDATRNTEAVWNEDGPEDSQAIAHPQVNGASGGGCSGNFTAQGWQSNIAGFANTGCGTTRLAADVSALADPYTGYDIYDSYNDTQGDGNGWQTYGGTSLSSPLVAAMWALAGGAHGVSYPSLTLYGHANSSSPFYDVTKGYVTNGGVRSAGGNDWCDGDSTATCSSITSSEKGKTNPNGLGKGTLSCAFNAAGTPLASRNQCTAASGFDGPSGVGAPTGLGVFAPMTPTPSFSAPVGVNPGVSTAFSGSATDPFPGGTISSYSWSWGDATSNSTGTSPSHIFAAPGTYTVTLTANDSYGQIGTVSHSVSVSVPGPTVTSVSPSSGPAVGGTSVTITGTGFTGATAVSFGTAAATGIAVNSATSITAISPSHTAGAPDVTVTTPSGTSPTGSTDTFTYVAAPTVTSVSPTTGLTSGGTSVTVTGTGFSGTPAVSFGGVAATGVTVNSATSITAISPAHAAGAVDVTVTTPNGTSAAGSSDSFTYSDVPAITSVSPSSGPAAGGTAITITGVGFAPGSTVVIGQGSGATSTAIPATNVTVVSPTTITATTGGGAIAGSWNVFVVNSAGAGTGAQFTYQVLPPTITSISPNSGPTAGGTAITITGTNFSPGISAVIGQGAGTGIGAIAMTNVTVVSPTTITATTGGGATAGSWNVFVTTSAGTATGAQFTYQVLPPTITSISPNSGPAAGGTAITITGVGFAPGSTVVIGQGSGATSTAIPATNVTVVSPTTITATTGGGGAGSWNLFVVDTAGAGTGAQFTYQVLPPTITSISPNSGPAAGGTAITITGVGFAPGSTVVIGQGSGATSTAIPATNVTVVSPTTITATTGGGAIAGSWNVFVVNSAGAGTGAQFTYQTSAGPTIALADPWGRYVV
jgi:hypothetical protein